MASNIKQHKAQTLLRVEWGIPGVQEWAWCRLSSVQCALENHLSDEWLN